MPIPYAQPAGLDLRPGLRSSNPRESTEHAAEIYLQQGDDRIEVRLKKKSSGPLFCANEAKFTNVTHGWILVGNPRSWCAVYRFRGENRWMTMRQYLAEKKARSTPGGYFTTKRGFCPASPPTHTHAWFQTPRGRIPVQRNGQVFEPLRRVGDCVC